MPFKPGQSGNPTGRPRGAAGLARYIAEQTQDGRELIDRLLAVSRGDSSITKQQADATQALLDRSIGKPMQPSEIHALVEPVAKAADRIAEAATDEELDAMVELDRKHDEIAQRARARLAQPALLIR